MLSEDVRVISTGSQDGNCVLYFNEVMVDVGIPFVRLFNKSKKLNLIEDLKVVLLTHTHGDHIHYNTLASIQRYNPAVKVVCGEWMKAPIDQYNQTADFKISNVYIIDVLEEYNIDDYFITAFPLSHDVLNCGYFIEKDKVVVHATDTYTMANVPVREDIDYYAIEFNFDRDYVEEVIDREIKETGFSHRERAIETHLSFQVALGYIRKCATKKQDYIIIPLHTSSAFKGYLKQFDSHIHI